jgi:hypothetical protein
MREVLRDEHAGVIRESVRVVAKQLMEVEPSELIGAQRGEDRATHRNGYRPRRWDTRAGDIELQIPRIRQGGYLQPRKGSEPMLLAGCIAVLSVAPPRFSIAYGSGDGTRVGTATTHVTAIRNDYAGRRAEASPRSCSRPIARSPGRDAR